VDSDGDGFVNFEEFKQMMSNNKAAAAASNW
jgi:Ca2+-binding EF-hand superfamily protein